MAFNRDKRPEQQDDGVNVAPWMRRELGNRMKIRNVPQLVFEVDHSIEYGAHINDIINQLSAEQEPEVEE